MAIMLTRDWGRGRELREPEGIGDALGLSGDETKFGELKEREGARSRSSPLGGRRGPFSKVGVVGDARGEEDRCWNCWSSVRDCRSRSSFEVVVVVVVAQGWEGDKWPLLPFCHWVDMVFVALCHSGGRGKGGKVREAVKQNKGAEGGTAVIHKKENLGLVTKAFPVLN
jgi:hypothetical protein